MNGRPSPERYKPNGQYLPRRKYVKLRRSVTLLITKIIKREWDAEIRRQKEHKERIEEVKKNTAEAQKKKKAKAETGAAEEQQQLNGQVETLALNGNGNNASGGTDEVGGAEANGEVNGEEAGEEGGHSAEIGEATNGANGGW